MTSFRNAAQKDLRQICLSYVNEVLFEMVKTVLKNVYLGGKIPTALKNKVSTCLKMCHDKDNRFMFNQLVNVIFTQFLIKVDAFPRYVVFPLEFSTTFFNNLSPEVRELLIS